MTNIEPPSGFADLNGQVDSIEDERAKLERERAEFEQERALVRQRREREDQTQPQARPMVLEPNGEPAESVNTYTPAVVDSDGAEYELDVDTGEPILGSDGNPIPKWPYDTIELDGHMIQVRKPKPEAIQAVAMAGSKALAATMGNDMVALFVKNHMSELSYGRLFARMMDPDDTFSTADFGKLFERIATMGTGRPTGPSRP